MTLDLTQIGQGFAELTQQQETLERLSRLSGTKSANSAPDDGRALQEQAQEFEALFIKMMLDAMRKSVQHSDLFGDPDSPANGIYRSMLDSEYAKIMAANQRFGLTEMLLDQFGAKTGDAEDAMFPDAIGPLGDLANGQRQDAFFLPPAKGELSSPFGLRTDPFSDELTMHEGVDLAMPVGRRVHASLSGTVSFAGEKGGYGKLVVVDHPNGYQTVYGHLDSIEVEPGERVRQGQAIARSGETGRSTGPHLHFEIRKDGRPQNPAARLNIR
ncbi:MAG: hypothetical protein C4523_10180 [Myxococcales bacterium]|nr:MAG: hypothetical protein C4523_10180 [Myxococcales bacterium]